MEQGLFVGLFVVMAYLLGSVPTAVWVSKIFYQMDVREHGSGNAGATNTIRVLGYAAGIPVLLFDVFKGWLAVKLALWIGVPGFSPDAMIYVAIGCAVAAVFGHVFPLFAGFRGGKGVGTLAGVGLALYPVALLLVLAVFIGSLIITHYVSFSSILGSVSFPFIVVFVTGVHQPALVALAILVAVFVPVTHRKNITRLLRGEENRFQFRQRKK